MMTQREQGFTLIELLVVTIIVGILGTLVAMTYSGVQVKNRNAKRQTHINTVQSQLETYYAEKSAYPTLMQLNDPQWRRDNLKSFQDGSIRDPQWNDKVAGCAANSAPTFASAPTAKCYSYQATTTEGAPCSDQAPCVQYTLTTVFEGGEKYVKTSLN